MPPAGEGGSGASSAGATKATSSGGTSSARGGASANAQTGGSDSGESGGNATNTGGNASSQGGSTASGGASAMAGGTPASTGGTAASSGGNAAATAGATASPGGSPAQTGGLGSSTGGTFATGTPCADVSSTTTAVPPVLEFQIDITGSMGDDAYPANSSNNATKWAEMQRVLPGAFASLPSSWAVGVSYFNRPNGCYTGRQAVSIAPLAPAQLTSINSSITSQRPNGYTPTLAAWQFALSQLTSWQPPTGYEQSPRYIVLITDGIPTVTRDGCTVQNPINQAEYDYLVSTVQTEGTAANVKTFVVGVLGSEDPQGATYDPLYMLSQVAVAGGTPQPAGCVPQTGEPSGSTVNPRGTYCHFDMTANQDFAAGLTEALQSIAQQVVSCTYQVPAAPDGRFIDPRKILITYTPGGGTPRDLTKAANSDCTDGQWYVSAQDATGIPTELQLCPTTCDAASTDNGAEIKVTFTCLEIQ